MSKESRPEPLLKSDTAKFDTSSSRSSQENLKQEAAIELSSPHPTQREAKQIADDIYEIKKGRQFAIYAKTNSKDEESHKIEQNSIKNQNKSSDDPNAPLDKSTKISDTPASYTKTKNTSHIDFEFPIKKIR